MTFHLRKIRKVGIGLFPLGKPISILFGVTRELIAHTYHQLANFVAARIFLRDVRHLDTLLIMDDHFLRKISIHVVMLVWVSRFLTFTC